VSIADIVTAVLLVVGALLTFIASLGVLRFPDPLSRASAASKASTLGAICILAAYGIFHAELGADARAFAAIVFLLLTAPVGAFAIARAAYRRGDVGPDATFVDELAGHEAECEESLPPIESFADACRERSAD
jgi:multicomponent Na+:H+ antiporter subunit G